MTRRILFFLIQIFWFTAGFAQSPPWKENGEAIPARADLDVRWEASNKFPQRVWIYQLLPNHFSPKIISNVMALCSLSTNDLIEHGSDGMSFQRAGDSRKLSILFSSGNIHYEVPEPQYSPTNLAIGVPPLRQLPQMATNVLRKLQIRFSDITGYYGTNNIEYSEPVHTEYYMKEGNLTNIAYRSVLFRRKVDGMPVIGNFSGFNVGEHGQISKLSITWPNLKRVKSYPTVSQQKVINLLCKGEASRGPVPTNIGGIDWPNIKGVKIKMAVPSYEIAGDRLYPFLRLDVVVDTGHQSVEIGMDCSLIDD
jgi:hypothetical protein